MLDMFRIQHLIEINIIYYNMIIITMVWTVKSNTNIISGCIEEAPTELLCKCKQNEMVKIISMVFAYNPQPPLTTTTIASNIKNTTPTCIYDKQHCQGPDKEYHACVGRSSCAINLPGGFYGPMLAQCGMHANYAVATYQCIRRTDVLNICKHNKLTAQSAYLSSPNYPYNYDRHRQYCTVHVKVSESQRIYLYTLDFRLGDDCRDRLEYNNIHGTGTICRDRQLQLIDSKGWGTLSITFNATSQSSHKGFWIYYKALPYINNTDKSTTSIEFINATINVTPDTTPARTPQSKTSTISSSPESNEELGESERNATASPLSNTHRTATTTTTKSEDYITVIIVGVILSLILLALVILLIIIIKRQRKTEAKQSQSTWHLSYENNGQPTCSVISNVQFQNATGTGPTVSIPNFN